MKRKHTTQGDVTLAGSWSAKELTDGLIPQHMIAELAGTEEEAQHLVDSEYWFRVEGGFQFGDWAPDQPLREAVLETRRKTAEKVKDWRSRNLPSNPVTNPATNPVTNPSVTLPPSRPVPTRPDPLKDEVHVPNKPARDYSEEFKEFWGRYPRHQGKVEAARAFKAARKTTDLKTLLDGAQAYALLQIGVNKALIKMPAGWLNDERWDDDQIAAHVPDKGISKDARAFSLIEQGRAMDNRQLASVPHHPTDAEHRSSMCSEPGHEEYPLQGGCEACKRRVGLAVGVSF